MSTHWHYFGESVHVPRYAEVPSEYRPGKQHAHLVQEAIEQVELRPSSKETWKTVDVDEDLRLFVIPVGREPRIWGVHVGHTAINPQVSPFVRHQRSASTRRLTVHLAQHDGHILLVRAYAGEYCPPLPWQSSARGTIGVSRDFWHKHAYVYNPKIVVAGTRSGTAPDWFRP